MRYKLHFLCQQIHMLLIIKIKIPFFNILLNEQFRIRQISVDNMDYFECTTFSRIRNCLFL
jgi:hypothetical protein